MPSGVRKRPLWLLAVGTVVGLAASACSAMATAAPRPFLPLLGKPAQLASTVPANGDVNPYGIAVVPATEGKLVAGDTLVSNFNDKANVQGTGTTIVQVGAGGGVSLFARLSSLPLSERCPGGVGLTTALAILPGGWVAVGSLPAGTGGALPNANPAGCLIVLNDQGVPVETWSNPDINGPWDMTAATTKSGADLFVSNALSRPAGSTTTPAAGLCTVVRIDVSLPKAGLPTIDNSTVIGSGFVWQANKTAFVLAPTGAALGRNGTLYVASTIGNHITAIPAALSRKTAVADGSNTLTSGGFLNGPLGLTLAPNGDLIAVNGNDGNAVEITTSGHQVAHLTLIPNGAGDLFGLAPAAGGHGLLFVNDGTNALDVARG